MKLIYMYYDCILTTLDFPFADIEVVFGGVNTSTCWSSNDYGIAIIMMKTASEKCINIIEKKN